jgi:hypothetical protein
LCDGKRLLRELRGSFRGIFLGGGGFTAAALGTAVDDAFYGETNHAVAGGVLHVFFFVLWHC